MSENERIALATMGAGYGDWQQFGRPIDTSPPLDQRPEAGNVVCSVALALGYEFDEEGNNRTLLEPVTVAFTRRWTAAEFRSRPQRCLSWLTSALAAEFGEPTGDPDPNANEAAYQLAWHFFRWETDIVNSVAEDLGVDVEEKGAQLIELSLLFSRRFRSEYPQRAEFLATWLAVRVEALVA